MAVLPVSIAQPFAAGATGRAGLRIFSVDAADEVSRVAAPATSSTKLDTTEHKSTINPVD
jgi:hypothetical protein